MGDNSHETSVAEQNVDSLSETSVSVRGPVPVIEIPRIVHATPVDLDRKLPIRLKKHEYEPREDGQLMNISQPLIRIESYHGSQRSKDSSRLWSKEDEEITALPGLQKLPLFSDWFDVDGIHAIEIEAFPYFCGPEASALNKRVYRKIRNSMVQAYLSCPLDYLTITECYENLVFDIHDIASVHTFLERYHLINYNVWTVILIILGYWVQLAGDTLVMERWSCKAGSKRADRELDLFSAKGLSYSCIICNPHI